MCGKRIKWQTHCCAEGGFMGDVQRWRGWNAAWQGISFVKVVRGWYGATSWRVMWWDRNCKRVQLFGGCQWGMWGSSDGKSKSWMKFGECGELLRGWRFLLQIKGKIYKSCVRPATLYWSKVWCLRENEMAILRRTEGSIVTAMC